MKPSKCAPMWVLEASREVVKETDIRLLLRAAESPEVASTGLWEIIDERAKEGPSTHAQLLNGLAFTLDYGMAGIPTGDRLTSKERKSRAERIKKLADKLSNELSLLNDDLGGLPRTFEYMLTRADQGPDKISQEASWSTNGLLRAPNRFRLPLPRTIKYLAAISGAAECWLEQPQGIVMTNATGAKQKHFAMVITSYLRRLSGKAKAKEAVALINLFVPDPPIDEIRLKSLVASAKQPTVKHPKPKQGKVE